MYHLCWQTNLKIKEFQGTLNQVEKGAPNKNLLNLFLMWKMNFTKIKEYATFILLYLLATVICSALLVQTKTLKLKSLFKQ